MDIIDQFKRMIKESALFKKGDRVIIGVSGGADSICLLYLLDRFRYDLGIALHVVHVNHNLRCGSKLDEHFVIKTCAALKLPLTVKNLEKKFFNKVGSIEALAREYRYQAFRAVAKANKITKIVLGHTQDDLAETILMHLLRGTGFMGMRGMIPKREMQGVVYIRPLIDISRKEIEIFLKSEKIKFRNDPSNQSLKFFRNKIRKQLIPFLQKGYNENIKASLAHLSGILAQDYDFIERQANKHFERLVTHQGSRQRSLSLNPLAKLHPSLQRMVIRLTIKQLKGNINQITFQHIQEIADLIFSRPDQAVVHLPNSLRVTKRKNSLDFSILHS